MPIHSPADRKSENNNHEYVVRLCITGQPPIEILTSDNKLYREAQIWNRLLGLRKQWINDDKVRKANRQLARRNLESLGLNASELERLANAEHIEVQIPYETEDQGYAARVFPWEYVLSSAAKHQRKSSGGSGSWVGRYSKLLITRHLICTTPVQKRGLRQSFHRLLYVASQPASLGTLYSFEEEHNTLEAIAKQNSAERDEDFRPFTDEDTPTLRDLQALVRDLEPDVVHLSGIDTHEGRDILGEDQLRGAPDGLLLRHPDQEREYTIVEALDLAKALNYGNGPAKDKSGTAPNLVAFNCYYSASRLAAMAVAYGTRLSIGFQDFVDEELSANFFSAFYRAYTQQPDKAINAFRQALHHLDDNRTPMQGSGIVLWARHSLIMQGALPRPALAPPKKTEVVTSTGDGDIEKPLGPASIARIEIAEGINYSKLHNGSTIFEKFELSPPPPGDRPVDVDVEVTLNIGSPQGFRYTGLHKITKFNQDIAPRIQFPLTWSFARELRESVKTTLFYEVKQNGVPLERGRATRSVVLHPLNEWRDSQTDGAWLPSFIFPRDRAISDLVTQARHSLMTLRDDPNAGFDGYQSRNPVIVNQQARAIWSTLSYNHNIGYVDPPPTYSELSQRLRTPSEVLNNQQGTCIDLCLMYASCLEYIGLFPVVFLTKGHAFTGYWSSEEENKQLIIHKGYQYLEQEDESDIGGARQRESGKPAPKPYEYTHEYYRIVAHFLNDGHIIPIETTGVTRRGSFNSAIDEAFETLKRDDEFESMLDVRHARGEGVTPLAFQGDY